MVGVRVIGGVLRWDTQRSQMRVSGQFEWTFQFNQPNVIVQLVFISKLRVTDEQLYRGVGLVRFLCLIVDIVSGCKAVLKKQKSKHE